MTSEELVDGLKKKIIDLVLEYYIEMFNGGVEQESERFELDLKIHDTKINASSKEDQDWSNALKLYTKLTKDQKRTFFIILRQVQIDTLSGVLTVLDGNSWLETQKEEFELICRDNPAVILNGELTDMFLNEVYEWDR